MQSPFYLKPEGYTRNIDPVNQYLDQAAFYLSKVKKISIEEARDFVKQAISSGGIADVPKPVVVYTERNENGDREIKETPIVNYIYTAVKNNYIMSPTLTCYLPETVEVSIPSLFIKDNIDGRSAVKKKMFAAVEEAQSLERELNGH